MDEKKVSRAYLETLASADLISLADEYGIDVPEDLSRRFIIAELLEVAEELSQERDAPAMHIADEKEPLPAVTELPDSFNETQIGLVLRNPVWVFVYWDIKKADIARCSAEQGFKALLLRVSFFADEESSQPIETFDVQVATTVREQYVLLPAGKQFVRVDLVLTAQGKPDDVLAYTQKYALPNGSPLLSSALPWQDFSVSKIAELSSLKELLRAHYENHRQSFIS